MSWAWIQALWDNNPRPYTAWASDDRVGWIIAIDINNRTSEEWIDACERNNPEGE